MRRVIECKLEALNIANTGLNDRLIKSIFVKEGYSGNPALLERLNLSRSNLTDVSCALLVEILGSHHHGLTELDLSWNKFGIGGVHLIRDCQSLVVLNLSYTPLGQAGARTGAKQKGGRRGGGLSTRPRASGFSTELAEAIANNWRLLHLDLSGCYLTQARRPLCVPCSPAHLPHGARAPLYTISAPFLPHFCPPCGPCLPHLHARGDAGV